MAFGLLACNNTTSSKGNDYAPASTAQITDASETDALLGAIITADGIGSLILGTKIPDTIPGYDVIFVIYEVEEGMEDVIVEVNKEGRRVLQIHPGYVDETDAANDTIAGLIVTSDQFATADGIHVGSSVNDILKRQGATTYFNETRFYIKDNGLTYLFKLEDYEGMLPEVPFGIPVVVEQPIFKADAKVRAIGIYGD